MMRTLKFLPFLVLSNWTLIPQKSTLKNKFIFFFKYLVLGGIWVQLWKKYFYLNDWNETFLVIFKHYATHLYAVVDAATINRQKMVNFMMMLVLDRLVKLNCDKERFLGSSFSCCLALVRLAWEQARDGERHRLYKWNFLQRNERFRPLA